MNFNFDIYAMVKPKTPEDIITLCHEALRELGEIREILDEITKACLRESK